MVNKSFARREIAWLFALVLAFGLALGGWIFYSKRVNPRPHLTRKFRTAINQVGFSADGKQFVVVDKGVKFFDVESELLTEKVAATPSLPFEFDLTSDGRLLATSHNDDAIRLWSLPDGSLIRTIKAHDSVPNVAFSPDGKLLASSSWSKDFSHGEIRLWNVASGKLILRYPDQPSFISDSAFAPDGKTLFTAGGEGKVKQWNVSNGQLVREFVAPKDSLLSVAVSPDGKRIAAGGWGKKVRIWNVATGALESDIPGDGAEVRDLQFSSDSKALAISASHSKVSIWDVNTHSRTHLFDGHEQLVFSVRFSPDNSLLVSSDMAGRVQLWRIE